MVNKSKLEINKVQKILLSNNWWNVKKIFRKRKEGLILQELRFSYEVFKLNRVKNIFKEIKVSS